MSEIPELPPFSPRARPLPPGGIESAIAGGRSRRNRFLGVTGGTTTALALVLAAALALPADRNDSLDYAEPEPTATAAADPSAQPQPTPDAGAPAADDPDSSSQPSPGAESQSQGQNGPAESTAEPAAPEGQPVAAPASRERDAYVEEPRDTAAPADCRQYRYPDAGPVAGGDGVSCSSRASSGQSTVASGGSVSASVDICVPHGGDRLRVGFAGGQEHEVTVFGQSRERVYRFSDTVTYPQGAHERIVEDGRCLAWTGVWDVTLADGSDAPPGDYLVRVAAVMDTFNGEPADDVRPYVEFTVTVTD
jgi:hypothetical protein